MKRKFAIIILVLIIGTIMGIILINKSHKKAKKTEDVNLQEEKKDTEEEKEEDEPQEEQDVQETSNQINSNSNKVTSNKTKQTSNKTTSKSNQTSNKASNKTSNTTSNKNSNTQTNNSKVVGKTTKGYDIVLKDGIYYIKGILIANKTYPLPSSYNPGGLMPEFSIAFNNMKTAAKNDGINLVIMSGFRSYSKQKRIYENYVADDGQALADTYSARPGHSEHQSGLAADLNNISDSFAGTKEAIWLSKNCYKYGFILRYPQEKQSITGYKYEPWHFRYIGDEAKNLYKNGTWITLEEYLGIDSKYQ